MCAVFLKLILGEEDAQELFVSFLMGCLDPLLEHVDIKVVLLGLKGRLERHI